MSTETLKPTIEQEHSADVHAAVEKTLGQMFGLQVTSTFKMIDKTAMPSGDVTAVMSLVSKTPIGALILIFPRETLFTMLKQFYKRDFTEINNVVTGAVGEITNIVFGVFKFRLRDKGYQFTLSMPQVVAGASAPIANTEWIYCGDFTCPAGSFQVALVRCEDKT